MNTLDIWILAIALIVYYVLHSLLASEYIKQRLPKSFINPRFYRIIYNAIAILLLIPIAWIYKQVDAHFLFEVKLLSYLGIFLLASGLVLMFFALRQYDLGEFAGTQQLRIPGQPKDDLKTDGFNAYVRHPLYFSGLLLLWGWFLYQATNTFLVIAFISTLYLYIGTRLEEQKLLNTFGDAYRIYQEKVPMLLPFPKKKHRN